MRPETIAVTGATGLLGKELVPMLENVYPLSSKNYNLTEENGVKSLFTELRPDIIVHLAACVGGIQDNISRQADYFDQNVLMNTLMVKYAKNYQIKRFITILSTCAYPDTCFKYPMTEDMLHIGAPAESNFSYAMAKRMMACQIDAYNKQFGLKYQYFIPCNLYGPHDKFSDNNSHFVAALVKKISTAIKNNQKTITLFGTGKPKRQFLYAKDFAEIIKICIDNKIYANMNVVSDEEYSIKEIAHIALQACNATHLKIRFDKSKPDGQYKKTASNNLLESVLPGFAFTSLYDGIKATFKNFHSRQ